MLDHDRAVRIAADLVRAVRGRRSQADFSRRIGYRSNIAHRWESGRCWPTAAAFLQICARLRPQTRDAFARFLKRTPAWLDPRDPFSEAGMTAFVRELQGTTKVSALAERVGRSRFTVSRWLQGSAQPKLPELLSLVEAATRRGLDFIATLVDPARMVTIAHDWTKLQRARQAAYGVPWSHAVLHALELTAQPRGRGRAERWLAAQLGIDGAEVERGLSVLEASGQVRKTRGRWRADQVIAVDTSQDASLGRSLKAAWMQVALDRLQRDQPGYYGYSLFAVSRRDLRRLREIHARYAREMQNAIADSTPAECVGLYCAQLLHLSTRDNVFG